MGLPIKNHPLARSQSLRSILHKPLHEHTCSPARCQKSVFEFVLQNNGFGEIGPLAAKRKGLGGSVTGMLTEWATLDSHAILISVLTAINAS